MYRGLFKGFRNWNTYCRTGGMQRRPLAVEMEREMSWRHKSRTKMTVSTMTMFLKRVQLKTSPWSWPRGTISGQCWVHQASNRKNRTNRVRQAGRLMQSSPRATRKGEIPGEKAPALLCNVFMEATMTGNTEEMIMFLKLKLLFMAQGHMVKVVVWLDGVP